jgi:hypothetical protein
MKKKSFLADSVLAWYLAKSLVAGAIYATSAFFTKKWWEKVIKD